MKRYLYCILHLIFLLISYLGILLILMQSSFLSNYAGYFMYHLHGYQSIFIIIGVIFLIYLFFEYVVFKKLRKSSNLCKIIFVKTVKLLQVMLCVYFFGYVSILLGYRFIFEVDNFLLNYLIIALGVILHICLVLGIGVIIFNKVKIHIKENKFINIANVLGIFIFIFITLFIFYISSTFKNSKWLIADSTYMEYLYSLEMKSVYLDPKFEDQLGSKHYSKIISLNDGRFRYKEPLFYIPGKGIDFEFNLYYSSSAVYNGPVGNSWNYSHNTVLKREVDGNFVLHPGSSTAYILYKKSENYYESNVLKMNMTYIDGKYLLRMLKTNDVYTFIETNKRLLRPESLEDAKGNKLKYHYGKKGQLLYIQDTFTSLNDTNKISFVYYDNTRIKSISDYKGNMVKFNYYGKNDYKGKEYDLISLEIYKNNIKKRTIRYGYYPGGKYSSLLHTVDDPGSNYILENKYDEKKRLTYYKVKAGVRYYKYTLFEGTEIVKTNYVIDREGNHTLYTFDRKGNIIKKENGDGLDKGVSLRTKYVYNTQSKLVKEIYPSGYGVKHVYDKLGRQMYWESKVDILDEESLGIKQEFIYEGNKYEPSKIKLPSGEIIHIEENYSGSKYRYYSDQIKHRVENTINSINDQGYLDYLNLSDKKHNLLYNEKFVQLSTLEEDNIQLKYLNRKKYEVIRNEYTKILTKKFINDEGVEILITYNYDVNQNLLSMNFSDGKIVNFKYDGYNRLTKIIDTYGNQFLYMYDEGYEINEIRVTDKNGKLVFILKNK